MPSECSGDLNASLNLNPRSEEELLSTSPTFFLNLSAESGEQPTSPVLNASKHCCPSGSLVMWNPLAPYHLKSSRP